VLRAFQLASPCGVIPGNLSEIKYDNQGGHKKLRNLQFPPTLSHLSIATSHTTVSRRPLSVPLGDSKHNICTGIVFSGQNITATKEGRRANIGTDPRQQAQPPDAGRRERNLLDDVDKLSNSVTSLSQTCDSDRLLIL